MVVRRGYGDQALVSQRSTETEDDSESWGILEIWRALRQRKGTWLVFAFIVYVAAGSYLPGFDLAGNCGPE